LVWSVSTVVESWRIMAVSLDMVGSAMEVMKGVGEGGGAVNGGGAEEDGVEVDEDRLEADTRLSRAWASRVAGPWLQSS